MIENALYLRGCSAKTRLTAKSLISLLTVVLAVILPQIAHLAAGAGAGVKYLPMYLPVLLGGCLLGPVWGAAVGVMSPLVSFIITGIAGSAMPAAGRLPFMMAELAVFAVVTGLFSKKLVSNAMWAFPAVIAAELAGRSAFIALVALFGRFTSLSVNIVWSQIKAGFIGLILQAVIAPLMVIFISRLLLKEQK